MMRFVAAAFLGSALFLAACGEKEGGAQEIKGSTKGRTGKDLPSGFKSVKPDSGSGEVILARREGAASAKTALAGAFADLAAYFDARPKAGAAMADADDRVAQATFEGTLGGKAVRGLAVAHVGARDTVVSFLHDSPENFAASLPALSKTAAESVPKQEATSPKKVEWWNANIPDGSGTLKVPTGWTVSGQKGMVSAAGPQGSADLGLWVLAYTPEAAAQLFVKPPLVASYGDPAKTAQDLIPQFNQLAQATGGPTTRWVNLVEQKKVDWWPQGVGSYVLADLEVTGENGKKSVRALGLILMSPMGDGSFMYYWSAVASPSESFAENLPILLDVWASWKVSDATYRERLQKAAASMKECSRIYQETNAYRQKVMSDSNAAWSEYIRGTRHVKDACDGEVREVSTYGLDKTIDVLNRQEGYERWKVIPVKDLNR